MPELPDASLLAQPLRICGKSVRNRLVVPAMSDFGTDGPDGFVQQSHIDRYTAYARGGAGLVITEACSVLRMRENRDTLVLEDDACIPGLRRIAEAVHAHGSLCLVQIMLTGLSTMPYASIAHIPKDTFHAYGQAFVDAALRCRQAGFDGIELHAAHGMYLDQVLETSQRTDGYGGPFANRVRLLTELVGEIRALCGKDFILSVRLGNPDLAELVQTAVALEGAGADLLDVSSGTGSYRTVPDNFPHDGKVYAAALVKRIVSLPVVCVGNIFTGQEAASILGQGLADLVAVGRGHLADPAWTGKTLAGLDPVPCRRCLFCRWYVNGKYCPARKEQDLHTDA